MLVAVASGERMARPRGSSRFVDSVAPHVHPVQAATAVRFAFARHARDNGSAKAPIVGLVIVSAVLIGALTFGVSLTRFLEDPAHWGDPDVGIGTGGDEVSPELQASVAADPDVLALALEGTTQVAVGAKSLDVTGQQPIRGDLSPHVLSGGLPQRDDEIALGRVSARDLDVNVGDDLVIAGPAGEQTLRVTGLIVVPSVDGGDGVGMGGIVTFDGLQRIDPSARFGVLAVNLSPDAPSDAVDRLVAATGVQVGPFDRPSVIVNLERVRAIPFVVAAVLGLLVLLGLSHQLIVSGQRRRRDVAILRALGADRRWVTRLVHWQATVFTLVVFTIAVPIGIVLGVIVYRDFIARIGAVNTATAPLVLVGLALIVVVVLANVVAALQAVRVRPRATGVGARGRRLSLAPPT